MPAGPASAPTFAPTCVGWTPGPDSGIMHSIMRPALLQLAIVFVVGDFYGEQWIVTSGLTGGEQVIVDGAIKVWPGAPVKVVAPAVAPKPAGQ